MYTCMEVYLFFLIKSLGELGFEVRQGQHRPVDSINANRGCFGTP